MATLPKSLEEIRTAPTPYDVHPRALWEPFESFFASHGMTLWVAGPPGTMYPPDDRIRAPDGFFHRSATVSDSGFFQHTLATMCPARTIDGRDVVIRIVSFGNEGINHRVALERLSTGNTASLIGNHTVPVLQWLNLDNITFGVLPMLSRRDPTHTYCYENVEDVLKTMVQMLEGVAFLHSKLIAHLDLWDGNFLCNYHDDRGPVTISSHDRTQPVPPFRSTFPFKVYIIDFDTCVHFDLDSDPSTRVISGPPPGIVLSRYMRIKYPEMSSGTPYNPFLADVWQIGSRFEAMVFGLSESPDDIPDMAESSGQAHEHDGEGEGDATVWDDEDNDNFGLRSIPPAVVALVQRMMSTDPAHRPSAEDALVELRNITSGLSKEELKAPVHCV